MTSTGGVLFKVLKVRRDPSREAKRLGQKKVEEQCGSEEDDSGADLARVPR